MRQYRGHHSAADDEADAVRAENLLRAGDLEDLLSSLGVRPGFFQADEAYFNAWRSGEEGEHPSVSNASQLTLPACLGAYDSRNDDLLTRLAFWPQCIPNPLPVAGPPQLPAPATAGANPDAFPVGPVPGPPPFCLSWRHPPTSASRLPGSLLIPGVPEARAQAQLPSAASEARAAPSGTGATAANGPPRLGAPDALAGNKGGAVNPAPVLHLGFGILVRGGPQPHETSGTSPPVPNTGRPAPPVGLAASTAAGGTGGNADGGTGGGGGPRVGWPPFPPQPGARARRRCAEVFAVRRASRAPQPSDAAIMQGYPYGPLPPWYTRAPSAWGAASTSGERHHHQQLVLGKRGRDACPAATAQLTDSAARGQQLYREADVEDLEGYSYLRGRPRPHIMMPGGAERQGELGFGVQGGETALGRHHIDYYNHQEHYNSVIGGAGAAAAVMGGAGGAGPGAASRGAETASSWPDVADVSAVPQPREQPAEAAPYGELLYSVQRLGHDLCRRAPVPGDGSCAGAWRGAWVAVMLRVFDQLRRRLDARSAVNKYGAAGVSNPGDPPPSQPLTNHAQLRAAAQLLLLVVTELPSGGAGARGPRGGGPRKGGAGAGGGLTGGIAGEALDAADYLLGCSPLADFDGCDPQARAILVSALLQLTRLAAERSRAEGGIEADGRWGDLAIRAGERLVDWLVQQCKVVQHLETSPLERCTAEGQLEAAMRWDPAAGAPMCLLPDEEQHRRLRAVRSGHTELQQGMAAALAVLMPCLGPRLARNLLDQERLVVLLPPAITLPTSTPPREPHQAQVMALLHTALLTLTAGPIPGSGLMATAAAVPVPAIAAATRTGFSTGLHAGLPGAAAGLVSISAGVVAAGVEAGGQMGGGSGLAEAAEVVLQGGLRQAVEGVLRSDSRPADELLAGGQEPVVEAAGSYRDAAALLLGCLYGILLSQDLLAGWAAVEAAVLSAVGDTAALLPSNNPRSNPLRKAWEGGSDRRHRGLTLYLLGCVLRTLDRLGQRSLLAGAVTRCDPPGALAAGRAAAGGEQLGLMGVWLRAALDGASRPMLAALTWELVRCGEVRRLIAVGGRHGGQSAQGGHTIVQAAAAVRVPGATGVRPLACHTSAGVASAAPDGDRGGGGGGGGCLIEGTCSIDTLGAQLAQAVVADADGVLCAHLASVFVSGMVRENRTTDVRGLLVGLDCTWRSLRREMQRTIGTRPGVAGAVLSAGGGAGGPATVADSHPSAFVTATLRRHRAMGCVALSILDPCARCSLARHAAAVAGGTAAVGAFGGGGGGGAGRYMMEGAAGGPQRVWLEAQAPVRLLECVAEAVVDDAAALVRWEGGSPGCSSIALWDHRLRNISVTGLLPDLIAVLARSMDCRTDYWASPGHPPEPSVLQRCLALVCLLVSELPGPVETGATATTTTTQHLHTFIAAALANHLLLPDPTPKEHTTTTATFATGMTRDVSNGIGGGLSCPELPHPHHVVALARDNLARMLHRCLTGSLRCYVVEGLQVPVAKVAPARHAANALMWLRRLLGHPALRRHELLERLLPPLLNLVTESLTVVRTLLLTRGVLQCDADDPLTAGRETSSSGPPPPHSQPATQPRQVVQPPPTALLRELLDTATGVLEAAAGAGLLAPKEEAIRTAPGSVRIDASPLLMMEPALRSQLRAACGFVTGLLLRTCLECFAAPLQPHIQRRLLLYNPPPEEERGNKVRQRLASCFGTLPTLAEAEKPKAVRQACGEDVRKLSGAPAAADGADGVMKLSEAAVECVARMVQALGRSGYSWAEPVVESVREITKSTHGVCYTAVQREAVKKLLRSRGALALAATAPAADGQAAGPQRRPPPPPQPLPQQQQGGQPPLHTAGPQQQPDSRQEAVAPPSRQGSLGGPHVGGLRPERQQREPQPARRDTSPAPTPLQNAPTDGARGRVATSGAATPCTAAGGNAGRAPPAPPVTATRGAHTQPRTQVRASGGSDDHEALLAGCIPFAELPGWIVRQAEGGRAGQQTQHQSPSRASLELPPLVGEVVEVKVLNMKRGNVVVQLALRDASVGLSRPMVVYVSDDPDVLRNLESQLSVPQILLGVYGATYLAETPSSSTAEQGGVAPTRPTFPLKAKVRRTGVVVDPQTPYAAQLRLAMRAQRQAARASTMVAGIRERPEAQEGSSESIMRTTGGRTSGSSGQLASQRTETVVQASLTSACATQQNTTLTSGRAGVEEAVSSPGVQKAVKGAEGPLTVIGQSPLGESQEASQRCGEGTEGAGAGTSVPPNQGPQSLAWRGILSSHGPRRSGACDFGKGTQSTEGVQPIVDETGLKGSGHDCSAYAGGLAVVPDTQFSSESLLKGHAV